MLRRRLTPFLIAPTIALILLGFSTNATADNFPWLRYLGYPEKWFDGYEAKQIAENVLSHQSPEGSWPKNIDTGAKRFTGNSKELRGTFEAGATVGELRFLARIFRVTGENKYSEALEKGLKHILAAQYPSGGWPQQFPVSAEGYKRHIAFKDGCVLNILLLLREVATSPVFTVVRKAARDDAATAFDNGIQCIVKCQIEVKGDLTGWCARHDEKTFEPRPGQAFETTSIDGGESAAILMLLMTLSEPSENVVRAIHSGCEWLDLVKIPGIKLADRDGSMVVVRDNTAPPLWARCYEIGTNRPMFLKRDGTVKYKLADIEPALRTEVDWYSEGGQRALAMYAKWKDRDSSK